MKFFDGDTVIVPEEFRRGAAKYKVDARYLEDIFETPQDTVFRLTITHQNDLRINFLIENTQYNINREFLLAVSGDDVVWYLGNNEPCAFIKHPEGYEPPNNQYRKTCYWDETPTNHRYVVAMGMQFTYCPKCGR